MPSYSPSIRICTYIMASIAYDSVYSVRFLSLFYSVLFRDQNVLRVFIRLGPSGPQVKHDKNSNVKTHLPRTVPILREPNNASIPIGMKIGSHSKCDGILEFNKWVLVITMRLLYFFFVHPLLHTILQWNS